MTTASSELVLCPIFAGSCLFSEGDIKLRKSASEEPRGTVFLTELLTRGSAGPRCWFGRGPDIEVFPYLLSGSYCQHR